MRGRTRWSDHFLVRDVGGHTHTGSFLAFLVHWLFGFNGFIGALALLARTLALWLFWLFGFLAFWLRTAALNE